MHASNSTFKLDVCKCDILHVMLCSYASLHPATWFRFAIGNDMICELFLGISAMHAMICVWESSKQLIAMLHSALLDFWCWNESIMPIDTTAALCESNGCKCIGLQINPWLQVFGTGRWVQCYRSNVMPNQDVVPHNGIECKCNAMLSNAHAQCKAKTTMYTRIPWN